MNKERPFKSVRVTLSDDAIVMLEGLRKSGRFRSYSATIEEAIRALHELVTEHVAFQYKMGEARDNQKAFKNMLAELGDVAFKRLTRFVGLQRENVSESGKKGM